MIDEQFIDRVYRSSFGWSLLVLSYLLSARLISVAAGFAIGVGLALAVLRAIEAVVRRIYVPGAHHAAKVVMGVFGFAKYLVLAVIIASIVRAGWVSLPAFACGVGVPTTIMFLKSLAHFFSEIEFHPFWGSAFDPRAVQEID